MCVVAVAPLALANWWDLVVWMGKYDVLSMRAYDVCCICCALRTLFWIRSFLQVVVLVTRLDVARQPRYLCYFSFSRSDDSGNTVYHMEHHSWKVSCSKFNTCRALRRSSTQHLSKMRYTTCFASITSFFLLGTCKFILLLLLLLLTCFAASRVVVSTVSETDESPHRWWLAVIQQDWWMAPAGRWLVVCNQLALFQLILNSTFYERCWFAAGKSQGSSCRPSVCMHSL